MTETHITPADRKAFDALSSGDFSNFAVSIRSRPRAV